MRSEADTPTDQRFLMLMGRLSPAMIKELEDQIIPEHIKRLTQNGLMTRELEKSLREYNSRDRSRDAAFYTLYAYADIPLGRRYDSIWSRQNPEAYAKVDCRIEHALIEGWFPADVVDHGHKHVLFLRFAGEVPVDIPTFQTWRDIGITDWTHALSDSSVTEERVAANKARVATPTSPLTPDLPSA